MAHENALPGDVTGQHAWSRERGYYTVEPPQAEETVADVAPADVAPVESSEPVEPPSGDSD